MTEYVTLNKKFDTLNFIIDSNLTTINVQYGDCCLKIDIHELLKKLSEVIK